MRLLGANLLGGVCYLKKWERPVRLGVIGAGWFASRRHMPDAQRDEEIELTCFCRRDEEARGKLAHHFGISSAHAYADWEEMLEREPLDAVLIATPNNLHYTQALAALNRGIHVLLEKPMTIDPAEAWDLTERAAGAGLKLGVALNPPFWAHCHRMKHSLAAKEMGELESAAMYWTGNAEYVFGKAPAPANLPGIVPPTQFRSDPIANGGGYFIDGGSHLVSEVLWVTNKRAVRVSCTMDQTPGDMRASLIITLENGAIATINSIGDSAFAGRRVRNVFGASGGVITVNGFEFDTTIEIHGHPTQKFREDELPVVGTPVGNFCSAIQGSAELFSTGEHGAHTADVVSAAYQSAATGEAVDIPLRAGGAA